MGMVAYKSLVKKVPISPEKKTKQKDYLPDGLLPIVDQGQLLIGGYSDNLNLQLSCNLPVLIFGDHTRAVKYVDFPFGAGADGIKVLEPAEGIYPKYLYYATQYLVLQLEDRGYARHYQYIEKKELDIPPFPEQKRIVTRIEELFSELDNGVETLRKTKQQLAVYWQAVLKAACDMNNAETVKISEIVDSIRIGPFGTMLHKTDYVTEGIPVVNPQHIKGNTIVAGEKVTISKEKAAELSAYKLRCNDIIMGRRGEMGRCAAVTPKEEGWICGTGSIVFRLKPEFDAAFYAQILSSPDVVRYLEENATGTTMKNLNEEIVRHIPVPYITREQQIAISKKIDAALSICDNIEKTVVSSLRQAEAMRQSILKQAFEGRL